MKKHLELEIKILQNAPKDPDKLERLLQIKQRQKEEETMHIDNTQRLVTEIEMLKVVLYLVCCKDRVREKGEEKKKKLTNLQGISPQQ